MNLHRHAILLTSLCLTASASFAQTTHGVALSDIDHSVKPGDNFFLYSNGDWIKRTPIPADRVAVGNFSVLADRADKQVAAIIATAAKSNPAPNTDPRRIADLYHSYMDEAAIEQHGLSALKPALDRIGTIKTQHDLARALGLTLRSDVDALNMTNYHTPNLFGLWVAPGFNDPDHYAPYLLQGGLVLPSRDYYLDNSAHMQEIRTKYAAHVATMFRLAGYDHPEQRASSVIALEHDIAAQQISLADNENIKHANNLWQASDFPKNAPGLDWPEYFRAAGISSQKSFYVWQPTSFKGESALVASTPIDTWKNFLILHTLEASASYLPKAFSNERFAFFGTILSGAPQQRPRDQRAIAIVNRTLGEAVGKLYAQSYFSPEAKAKAEAMVANLLAAFHHRLEVITWMAPATKAEAIRKLGTLKVSVGYADTWRTYDGLEIKPDDLAGNLLRASLFEYHYNLHRIGQPTDRSEWVMTPQTVNAVNLPLDNGLNFPAAILQPPFFDPAAPAASNYGAIGSIMGHEISHTFDTEGADFDSQGRVRDWWTPADFAHFNQVTTALANQFDTYEPLPGLHVNGRQTLGEDIADLGGIAAAYDAFHASLHGKPAPEVGGFTGDQQFFIAFGQDWKTVERPAALREQILTDPHAPAQDRAETVRNIDAWYAAFNVKPADKLYLTPDKRVHIW
ncbi:MAG: M13 family metallopeptidase [Acidobacteriaceae bacterium]